jgi:hypothetical protein
MIKQRTTSRLISGVNDWQIKTGLVVLKKAKGMRHEVYGMEIEIDK